VGTGQADGKDLPLRPQGVARGQEGPLEHPLQPGQDHLKACNLFVRIPSVVQVCRKVSGKSPAFKIYVPLPPASIPGKGNIIMLNDLKGLEDLCYSVNDLAMFVPEVDLEGVDIVKKWHDDTKSRVTDLDEATAWLLQYVLDRGNEQVDVEVYGPATDSGKQEQEALVQEQGTQVHGREEARRGAGGTQVRTVAQESAFTMVYVEPVAEEEQSVSAATLSGAAQAASHPNVAHFTDTLARMGYLQDFQNGVYLLLDPLGTELMGRRNKVAKHTKSKADAEKAMLILCREGKMEFLNNGLFRIPHFEEDKKPSGQDKASLGSSEHQPLKKKAKKVQAKPKVRKSIKSKPAKSANLYDAENPNLRALLAGLPATQVANRETGVHKAPRIDNLVRTLLVSLTERYCLSFYWIMVLSQSSQVGQVLVRWD
jgi:hypothetical protein